MPRERSYFVDRLPERKGELLALAWLSNETKTTQRKGLLVLPRINQIRDVLPEVIGEPAAKALAKTRSYRDSSGVAFDVVSWSQIPSSWPGPVLAYWPDSGTLDKLDAMYSVEALAVVIWNPVEQWQLTWQPIDLSTGEQMQSGDMLNPVVNAGLEMLTSTVNLSTGISHPSDRNAAIELFRKLKSARYKLDPDAIKRRLVQLNWDAEDAEQVRGLVTRVNNGSRFTGTHARWAENIIQQLKDEAQGGP